MKISISQMKKALSHDNDMLIKYPTALYFLGSETKRERVLRELSSNIFYEFCKFLNVYGCYDIYEVLLNKQIPNDIVEFYVNTGNGGSYELDIIFQKYGIGKQRHNSLELIKNDMILIDTRNTKIINKIFKGHAIEPTFANILNDLISNGEDSIFYKQLVTI